MKKNILLSLVALMAVALLSVGLASCGSDDEESTVTLTGGRWETINEAGNRVILQFGQAGNVQYTEYADGIVKDFKSLQYTPEGDQKGYIDWDGLGDRRYYAIADNKLHLYRYGYGEGLIDVFIKK